MMKNGNKDNKNKRYDKASSTCEDSKRNPKRAGKANHRRGYDSRSDETAKTGSSSSTFGNDPSWYEPFPGSTDLVARQSFGTPLGAPFKFRDYTMFCSADYDGGYDAFPGVMKIGYIPIPGVSAEGNYSSAVNSAAHAYYTSVRYAQRGSGTYDDSNLMLGTHAIFSLYEMWAFMRRLYGVLNMYSVSNKYLARTIFTASGGNFDDFQAHIYDFQGFINNFALKISEFCCPNDFSLVDRRVRLASNIFVDSQSVKAQMYFFNPEVFYYYNEFGVHGDELTPKFLPANFTYDQLVKFANDQYYSLRSSQTLMNMTGDVKNAYGVENIKHIAATSMDYMVPIVFDPQMCMEIQNCTLTGIGAENAQISIYADPSTNLIVCNVETQDINQEDQPTTTEYLLNIRSDAPTPQDVMRATRLMTFLETDQNHCWVTEAGTEVCTFATVYFYRVNSDDTISLSHYIFSGFIVGSGAVDHMLKSEKFDFHPYIYIGAEDGEGGWELRGVAGDVDNCILLPKESVTAMNTYAALGLMKTKRMDLFFTK